MTGLKSLCSGFIILQSISFINSSCLAADNVAVNITGTILESTCNVDQSSTSLAVPLGNIGSIVFNNPGDLSPESQFSIILNCPSQFSRQASVTFSGKLSTSDASLLALDDSADAAKGVAVRINESNGDKIDMDKASIPQNLVPGINTLMFSAQYQSISARSDIVAGTANATAQFTINYQ
ncbi:fimbrial protein [Citrobacter amalonaticus]|uniref:fimbrial protein n=1 Tax=Citrobacter amalonaticus TaxID=35703 RepID=UPI00300CA8F8